MIAMNENLRLIRYKLMIKEYIILALIGRLSMMMMICKTRLLFTPELCIFQDNFHLVYDALWDGELFSPHLSVIKLVKKYWKKAEAPTIQAAVL